MTPLKELLVDELQDLLSAENQIAGALPKMVEAANNSKLKESFQKHLDQTQNHVIRLKNALQLLGEDTKSQPCKGMKGILDEGQELIDDNDDIDELTADLALIGAAQKVEHYEITSYGTARCLAKKIGEREVALLLSHTLGEEEASDFLLTALAESLLQQALSEQIGNGTKAPWGEPGPTKSPSGDELTQKARAAVAGISHFKTKKTKS